MEQARVLLINPNPRGMSLISPIVSLFYSLLKNNNIDMRFFDTTFYDVTEKYVDPNKARVSMLFVKDHEPGSPVDEQPKKSLSDLKSDFRKEVETYRPDVIMTSATESTVSFAREVLAGVRDMGIPHVLGGVFATFAPHIAIEFDEFDAICCGEGENLVVPLVERLKSGQSLIGLPNLWFKMKDGSVERTLLSAPVELEDNPPFDVAPYHESRFYRPMGGKVYRMFPVETHRGCPLKCTFCNSPLQEATYKEKTGERYFRGKSLDAIFADVRYFVETCGAEYLFFWADNFLTFSRRDIDEFAERYADFGIPFYVQSYPTNIDEHKVKRLVEVGLNRIGLGIEHGNEVFRKDVINRAYSNEKAIEKVGILRKYDTEYTCNNIVGYPTETPELHWDTVMLNRALRATSAGCSIFTPFYGTPLREMSIEEGYLKDPDILAPSNNDNSVLEMPQFPKEVISGKARTFNLYVRLPEKRWKDIARAEKLTPEGDRIWNELKQEMA
jgi:anaerobic magnesium-protoporphyrin IX monomethyl ester cyclase